MKDRVVSLDEASILDGIMKIGTSHFVWYCHRKLGQVMARLSEWALCTRSEYLKNSKVNVNNIYVTLPAPLLYEMMDLLPDVITVTKTIPEDEDFPDTMPAEEYTADYYLWLSKHSVEYVDTLGDIALLHGTQFKVGDNINLATAASQLYRWMIKEGHIKGGNR